MSKSKDATNVCFFCSWWRSPVLKMCSYRGKVAFSIRVKELSGTAVESTDPASRVATHAAQTVAFTMQERKQRMSTSFPDAPVWLQADPARLEQVFVNLLFNAAKYTDPGGRIRLSAETAQGEAIVRVRDSGIEIEPKDLPHVFALFVQADPSSRRAEAGMGIGLALVRTLVERHGGRVTAASAGRGHGSEFTVRLPRLVE